ncbi:MAG: cytochrome c [Planctomycetota bacterium]|nr:cytochrome c [Planctomycetota bacterium]
MLIATTRTILLASLCAATTLGLSACGGGSEDSTPAGDNAGGGSGGGAGGGGATESASSVAAGEALFKINCAVCHGASGKGDGIGAAGLSVKPRDLTTDRYKFVPVATSDSEAAALVAYLKVGRVESGMPSFVHLKPEELESLALFVESVRPEPNFVEAPAEEETPKGEG